MALAGAVQPWPRAGRAARPAQKRFSDLRSLLVSFQRQERSDEAADVLDALEELAVHCQELRAPLVQLLDNPTAYEGAWSRDDADVCRSSLYQASGDYRSAAQLLAGAIHRLLTQGQVQRALDYHEHMKGFGLPGDDLAPLDARLAALRPAEPVSPPEPVGNRLRLLFVGGNAMQEKYDAAVADLLAKTHPGVEVDCLHTGWTSNWGAARRVQAPRGGPRRRRGDDLHPHRAGPPGAQAPERGQEALVLVHGPRARFDGAGDAGGGGADGAASEADGAGAMSASSRRSALGKRRLGRVLDASAQPRIRRAPAVERRTGKMLSYLS